ncbi:hypothetical protein [Leadbetterella byssophila]|uniref:hypothetical protein n=1 Tax=Leadbetterella byssophila TaxID=316068 RepID=UPI0039A23620
MKEPLDNSLGKSDIKKLTPLEAERRKMITISWQKGGRVYKKTIPQWKDLFEIKKIKSDGGKNITISPKLNEN